MICSASTKRCCKCNQIKSLGDFHRNRSNKDGLHTVCKPCNNKQASEAQRRNRAKRTEQQRAWKLKHKHKDREYYTRHRYGIELCEYEAMRQQQNGVCAICRNPPHAGVLCIDHCHRTELVRGLLCNCCNAMLGRLKDDKDALCRAIDYLSKHEETK